MDTVEQVKASADIVRTIEEFGVRLKKSAANRWTGLCPFHTEKTPSFSVNTTLQIYKCFGCGVGGDVFKFVMELEGISFFEALKLLAERNGIALPKRSDYSDPETRLRAALYEMNEIAAELFRANLFGPAGASAREYLTQRGVTAATAQEFGLGLADSSGQQLHRRLEGRFSAEYLEKSGLLSKRQDGSGLFDRFRARLMFPIHSDSGKTIGFGARALRPGDEPKYLNSPETELYHKEHVLYNLHRAKKPIQKTDRVLLVEGYMDVIGVSAAGVGEVVASCGTALGQHQIRSLKRYTSHIVVNFDPDAAGSNAAERSLEKLLDESMSVRILELEEELDPDEYIAKNGVDVYRNRVDKAPEYFHWLADRARKRFDMRTVEGRMDGWKFLMPAIQRLPDRLRRDAVVNDLAEYLGVEAGIIRDQIRRMAVDRRSDTPSARPQPGIAPLEKLLLNSLLMSEEARAELVPQLHDLPALERFQTRGIVTTLAAIADHCTQSNLFTELEARLGDNDKKLLSSIVFGEDIGEPEHARDQAMECLRKLEEQARVSRRTALKAQIKAAERAGDLNEAFRLTDELNRLASGR